MRTSTASVAPAALTFAALIAPLSASGISVETERAEPAPHFSGVEALAAVDHSVARDALQITLEPLDLSTVDTERDNVIGTHRDPPSGFQGDLAPLLTWRDDYEGGASASLTVTSPSAVSVRLALVVTAPEGLAHGQYGGFEVDIA